VFSGLLVFGILAAVFFIYAVLKRPEIALLGILIATASILFEDQLPLLSMGGISLHIPDFLLVGMLGLIVVRWSVEPEFKILRTPLDWPLLIFYGIMLFWTFNAIFHSTVDVEPARRGIRILSYYLTFFIVTNLVRERRQLNLLLNGFFLLATIVAAVMVAQYMLGSSVAFLPGRVEALNTQGVAYSDVTRILPPGMSIVLVAFVTNFCILVLEKFKPLGWLKFLQFGLLGMAFLFTFLRSYWLSLIIVFSLLAFILRGHDRQKLINWTVIICLAAVILQLVSSTPDSKVARVMGASADRLNTVFTIETFEGRDGSLNARKIENGYALPQILSHPLMGLGIGANYRPLDPVLDWNGSSRGFIHNGYLLILLNSGLFGFLSLMWLSLTFLIRGFKHWQSIANGRMRGVVLGFTLVYLAVLLASVVNSVFMQWYWSPVFGIIMGINEVILKEFRQAESAV
jgi:O-antigen ligase